MPRTYSTQALAAAPPASETASLQPTASAATGLTIQYEGNAQVEITGPSGRRILIDVAAPSALSKPVSSDDILLTTHAHTDHYNPDFVDAFPGQKITIEQGEIKLDDVAIVSIPAAHDDGDTIAPKDGSDYIFVIEIAGFRIAHFGDLGQSTISADQLAKIGPVDIAISQLDNSYSSMDVANQKGFHQMKQVNPLILIPTHISLDAAQLATRMWNATYSTGPLRLTRDQLPARTTVVFMGSMAATYGTMFKLAASPW